MGYVLILGANSDIGKVLAEKYALDGYNLYLADANQEELSDTKQYINKMCEADVQTVKFNVLEFYTHRNFYKNLDPAPMGVIFTADYTGDQQRSEKDFLEAKKIIDYNYTGLVSVLNMIANDFEKRKAGFIAATGSIVGIDNKQSLYTYTAAKQGFIAHLEGLRTRLNHSEVQVLITNNIFVHSKETKNIEIPEKNVKMAGDVAEEIFNAQQKGKTCIDSDKNVGSKILSFLCKC